MPLKPELLPTQLDTDDILKILRESRSVTARGTDFSDRHVGTTSSFFYDPPTQGLKSTQQLNVDWSRFEKHTFFSSAEVNVNVAFDKIINFYPFDGTRKELEQFFEGLTGFEKYVLDRFPKNVGYLNFSGSSFISVNDYAGTLLPAVSKDKSGRALLTPNGPFTLEFHAFLPSIANDSQIILQKISGTLDGVTAFVSSSSSTTSANVGLCFSSGSTQIFVSSSLTKGQFHHVAFVHDPDLSRGTLDLYIDGDLSARSIGTKVSRPGIDAAPLTIGSGTSYVAFNALQVPTNTFSGSLDEIRLWHVSRTQDEVRQNMLKGTFAQDGLVLYYKFNEPTGSFGASESDSINSLVLDSSGHSFHSEVTNFAAALRSTGSVAPPLTYEKLELSPVLFPGNKDVRGLNVLLLTSASSYDAVNPNLITRLVPAHYLQQGFDQGGFVDVNGTVTASYGGAGAPGSGQLGNVQLLLSLLYVWAKFFDDLKLYIDAFAQVENSGYQLLDASTDHFLPLIFKRMGFKIPSFFVDSSIEQFIDAENIQPIVSTDANSLQYVQNQIQRRVLANLNDVVRSKGTQHSVRSFLRSMGIDPDSSFRIKEYGGPTRKTLASARETKTEIARVLDFVSGGFIQSGFLSSSRVEVGYPLPQGTMVQKTSYSPHGISNSKSDGLFTSGSWTVEGVYRWPSSVIVNDNTQSLIRVNVTGSSTSANPGLLFNLLAMSGSAQEQSLTLYGRISTQTSLTNGPVLKLQLTGTELFDGERWNVSFGRSRSDEVLANSSSYYLRAARYAGNDIVQLFSTSSFFPEDVASSSNNVLQLLTGTLNVSGTFITVGSASIPSGPGSSGYVFLNSNDSGVDVAARSTNFNGQTTKLRFWSKSFVEDEWKEHVRNPRSLGVENPLVNFNFEKVATGSWQRLRLDISMDQDDRQTDSNGTIGLLDFSQNSIHASGSAFSPNQKVIVPIIWSMSFISPYIDENVTSEKVRVRSYQDQNRVDATPWAQVAPVYRITPSERPMDDPRFSIEFSLVDALNKDIITIFSTLDSMDDALGQPNLQFSADYPDLVKLRNVYFNRLVGMIELNRFYDLYRWFDASISSFVEQIVPRKTRFLGTNYVIESHMLERHKKEYFHSDMFVPIENRLRVDNVLLLDQVAGVLKRF